MRDFTIEDLKNYKMPDPSDRAKTKGLRDEISDIREKTDKAIIIFNAAWGLWECLWLMRGFEQAYIDIAADREFVELFFDKMLEWQEAFWKTYWVK